jgi:hypothetical protein
MLVSQRIHDDERVRTLLFQNASSSARADFVSAIRIGAILIRSILSLSVALAFLVPTLACAEAGFQFGMPDRNFPSDPDVNGMRLSFLWGNNDRTDGLDLGLFSMSQTRVRSGLALVGGVSRVTEKSDGAISLSFVNYHTGSDTGMNGAFINLVNDTKGALNAGFVQIATGETSIDVGGINVSKKSQTQIGFINVTEEITGFQFGFINMADNGFFKVFPIFNYPKKD